ncbi:MAG: hypothetical protein OXD33_00765 [Rhodobacteraceae bacterium]|nr:hypothetical protein [Paracoccaceae bacterium]
MAIYNHLKSSPECLLNFQGIMSHPSGQFLNDYLFISGSHTLIETAKLHAKADEGKNKNLSIDYFIHQTCWTCSERDTLKKIQSKINPFYFVEIKDWRNRIASHHDREMFKQSGEVLHEIPPRCIDEYLTDLGKLAGMIAKTWDFQTADDGGFDWSPDGSVRSEYQDQATMVADAVMKTLTAENDSALDRLRVEMTQRDKDNLRWQIGLWVAAVVIIGVLIR